MTNEKQPPSLISRRSFVGTVATAAGITIVPRHVLGAGFQAPSDTVNIAIVGYARGMGSSNMQAIATSSPGDHIVALCDCDESEAALTAVKTRGTVEKSAPKAMKYTDYRTMLEKQKDIDAVRRRHPGPHPRRRRARRDAARQARVRAEADDAHRQRSAHPHRGCAQVQGRHPDGQPGPLGRGPAADGGVAERRRHRPGARGPLLDQPADLAAGHAAADRYAGRAGRASIGTCGSARRRCARITRPTTRSAGARGRTSARARWATWAVT